MLRQLSDQYSYENRELASYAVHNKHRDGRRYKEEPHPFRTGFQRDRDRILHSRSFRRLEYKTQVFLNGTGDHLRTRLTHTIEVAAIARTIARALGLNEDLAETIALAHDLGHTPFGHAGERRMNSLMAGYGGFDHNDQALRVVDYLEIKYPDYNGINLSREVRAGLIKHRETARSLDGILLSPNPSLESRVADLSDDLTYYGHDVDDGLDSGLITPEMLEGLAIWREASAPAVEKGIPFGSERFCSYTVRCLIDMMVGDAIKASHANLLEYHIEKPSDAREAGKHIISFSPEFQRKTLELKKFLFDNLYFHEHLNLVNDEAAERISALFKVFCSNPGFMGADSRDRIENDGVHRAVADYIAGMTDCFAMKEYSRIFL